MLLGANVVIDVRLTSLRIFALLAGTLSHPVPTGSGFGSASSKSAQLLGFNEPAELRIS